MGVREEVRWGKDGLSGWGYEGCGVYCWYAGMVEGRMRISDLERGEGRESFFEGRPRRAEAGRRKVGIVFARREVVMGREA